MQGLDPFTPPTDSVYKFMALAGIVLLIATLALFWRLFTSLNDKYWSTNRRGRVLAKKLEMLGDWNANNTPGENTIERRNAAIDLACLKEEHEVGVSELKEAKRDLSNLLWLFPFLVCGSILLSAWGFQLWYDNLQIYQDNIQRSQDRMQGYQETLLQAQAQDVKLRPFAPGFMTVLQYPPSNTTLTLNYLRRNWPWIASVSGIVFLRFAVYQRTKRLPNPPKVSS